MHGVLLNSTLHCGARCCGLFGCVHGPLAVLLVTCTAVTDTFTAHLPCVQPVNCRWQAACFPLHRYHPCVLMCAPVLQVYTCLRVRQSSSIWKTHMQRSENNVFLHSCEQTLHSCNKADTTPLCFPVVDAVREGRTTAVGAPALPATAPTPSQGL